MVRFELLCPDGLPASTWAAIDYNRGRLVAAVEADDRPAVIGAAKELTESVGRSVLAATERQIGDSEDFPAIISAAYKALDRVPGEGTSASEPVRGIVGASQAIVLRTNRLRNDVGTGHGRAHLADITDEMAEVAADAAILWSRWALRRLGNVLKNYPGRLLEALAMGSNRARLQTVFDEVRLPEHFAPQLAEVLRPVPAKPAAQALQDLAARVAAATWMFRWRGEPVDPAATVAVLRTTQQQLDPDVRTAMAALADALDPDLRGPAT
jgi:hypothetical protein